MNVFAFDRDPIKCADAHCSVHTRKMLVEYCQLLSTAHHVLGSGRADIYKPTHQNHPSAIWLRESKENYLWLVAVADRLGDNYAKLKGKPHLSHLMLKKLMEPPKNIPNIPMTPFAIVCNGLDLGDPIETYREYFRTQKTNLHNWIYAEKPDWI